MSHTRNRPNEDRIGQNDSRVRALMTAADLEFQILPFRFSFGFIFVFLYVDSSVWRCHFILRRGGVAGLSFNYARLHNTAIPPGT